MKLKWIEDKTPLSKTASIYNHNIAVLKETQDELIETMEKAKVLVAELESLLEKNILKEE